MVYGINNDLQQTFSKQQFAVRFHIFQIKGNSNQLVSREKCLC
jgi:hypothetical protein